jgi:hypothetical protein
LKQAAATEGEVLRRTARVEKRRKVEAVEAVEDGMVQL